jgi:hypothetical protein
MPANPERDKALQKLADDLESVLAKHAAKLGTHKIIGFQFEWQKGKPVNLSEFRFGSPAKPQSSAD